MASVMIVELLIQWYQAIVLVLVHALFPKQNQVEVEGHLEAEDQRVEVEDHLEVYVHQVGEEDLVGAIQEEGGEVVLHALEVVVEVVLHASEVVVELQELEAVGVGLHA